MNVTRKLIDMTAGQMGEYDCNPHDFERVLLDPMSFEERQQRAIQFIRGVLTRHGKEHLRSYVAELASVEHGIKELIQTQRDHVVHSVRVFLLGIYFNETLLRGTPVDRLQWKLAGLTHDVGYPLEIAGRVGQSFGDRLNTIAADLGGEPSPVQYKAPRLQGLEKLTGGRNGLRLIQDRLNEWGIDLDANRMYRERTEGARVCHGVISALAVLFVLDRLYAKSNPGREHRRLVIDNVDWNQDWFDIDNVSACAAIFLHNLEIDCFKTPRIHPERARVAFLLRLADTLQEWDRPSQRLPDGLPGDRFDLDFDGTNIIYRAAIDDGHKVYLRRALDLVLENHGVKIV